jgi:putative Ca2+/H+ antiporter (TMEM165/GDT1 family)
VAMVLCVTYNRLWVTAGYVYGLVAMHKAYVGPFVFHRYIIDKIIYAYFLQTVCIPAYVPNQVCVLLTLLRLKLQVA